MAKVRVYEIAKEVGLESKEVVIRLQALGFEVKSHASALEEFEARDVIERILAEKKANMVEKRVGTRIIRRRPKRQPAEEAIEAEEEAETLEQAAAPSLLSEEAPPLEPATEPEEIEPPEEDEETTPVEAAEPEERVDKREPAPEEVESKPASEQPARAGKEDDFYRAKIVRRSASPPDASKYQAKVIARPGEIKPSGIRVLQVLPGKEGRGHQFIDVSRPDKRRKRNARTERTDMREALFDAFTPGFTPGISRRRRLIRGKGGRRTQLTTPKALKRIIRVESKQILASDLAHRIGVKLQEVNAKLRDLGEEIESLREDHPLDIETASMISHEYEYEIQDVSFKESDILQADASAPEDLQNRPPVVTVMGHVDHGKTSILDAIRKTDVTSEEAGGITQHIGAYEVAMPNGSISFIDTPGHEAFTAMRARGASITDIVVLVIAADDGIMPQTVEAINHAQAAGVPIMVAINKIDLPEAQPERVRQELTKHNLVPEQWGGDTIVTEVSAKTGQGLQELLDNIMVQAEMLELKADPDVPANGTIIEARLDRGRGPLATLLVQTGTLTRGDTIVVGTCYGRVRMMFSYDGASLDAQRPGRPVQVQGLGEVPQAGETFNVVKNEREARKLVAHRRDEARAALSGQTARLSLEDFYEQLAGTEKLELKVLVKADVQGTAEAVKDAIEKLSTDKVGIDVIHHGVGAISETDINLAAASNALVVGFNIRPDPNAKKLAEKERVDVRVYSVIYDCTEDIRKAQTGLLPTTTRENVIGRAEVRDLFVVPKVGTVAGVSVLDGKMVRNSQVRLLRDNVEVHQGRLASLRRFKDDVREVASGYECGIGIENYNDIKRGDIIEAFILEEEQPSL
ncbi:MAG: translation initiation factor IF-2 [Deltaproteobacteria bacterium]|nr:translation initiation factor IF-2 [Deltaproteobacteria bacterium]